MSLSKDFTKVVRKIFRETWTTRKGRKVPGPKELGLGNNAVELDGTILYADLDDSTNLVASYNSKFAAKIYKAYLSCAAKVIKLRVVSSLLTTVTVSWQCISEMKKTLVPLVQH